jgi:hypothetical protein
LRFSLLRTFAEAVACLVGVAVAAAAAVASVAGVVSALVEAGDVTAEALSGFSEG